METQKNLNLLNDTNNENSKFATKEWYVIHSETKGNNYLPDNEIKCLTGSLESNLCDYSDAYILVTGNITVAGGNANTKVAFKNCAPFEECRTEIKYLSNFWRSLEMSLKWYENCILSSAETATTCNN